MSEKDIDIFFEQAESWLNKATVSDIDSTIAEGVKLTERAENWRQIEPQSVGPLFGRIKGRLALLRTMEPIPWQPVLGGQLCVGHRPSKKKTEALKIQGATHLLTLLTDSEGAKSVEKLALSHELTWLWFPMEGGDPLPAARDNEARQLFSEMKALLEQGESIYIHCSAGIHRTGMLTNGLLRYLGNSQTEAEELLTALRQETSQGVGDHRKAWGDRFGQPWHSSAKTNRGEQSPCTDGDFWQEQ